MKRPKIGSKSLSIKISPRAQPTNALCTPKEKNFKYYARKLLIKNFGYTTLSLLLKPNALFRLGWGWKRRKYKQVLQAIKHESERHFSVDYRGHQQKQSAMCVCIRTLNIMIHGLYRRSHYVSFSQLDNDPN